MLHDRQQAAAAGPSPGPQIHTPGFRFVRLAMFAIVAGFGAMIGAIGLLAWHAEVDVTVEARGSIVPSERREARAAISGRISRIHVSESDSVEEGQILVELDDTLWRGELEKLERDLELNTSQVEETKARIENERSVLSAEEERASRHREVASLQLEQVRHEYQVYRDLYTPRFDVDRRPLATLLPIRMRQAALSAANAEVEHTRTRIRSIRSRELEIEALKIRRRRLEQDRFLALHRLNRASVRAPVSGTVITRDLEQRVGSSVQLGEPVIEIAHMNQWKGKVWVSESDIARVRPGQKARIYVDAFPHLEYKVFEGGVVRVGRKAERIGVASDPLFPERPGGYPVDIRIPNPTVREGDRVYGVRYGMGLSARIVVERGGVLRVFWQRILRALGRLAPRDTRLTNTPPGGGGRG